MAVANTLAYYDAAAIKVTKRFIVQVPGVKVIKPFFRLWHSAQIS